ncbi:hypothetical protein D3C77_446380 [compost metagenome]
MAGTPDATTARWPLLYGDQVLALKPLLNPVAGVPQGETYPGVIVYDLVSLALVARQRVLATTA